MKTHITLIVVAAITMFAASSLNSRADNGQKPAIPNTVEPEKPKVKPYPLETCIVSDKKLGEMGKPVVFEYKGQEIKLCCKSCRKDFDKDPAKFLKKLEPKK